MIAFIQLTMDPPGAHTDQIWVNLYQVASFSANAEGGADVEMYDGLLTVRETPGEIVQLIREVTQPRGAR